MQRRSLNSDWSGGAVSPSPCTLAQQGCPHGWREVLGPGHSDHIHLAHKSSQTWSASSRGT
jgi:zinc D-Ala-D-Ala carboxypeptidase